jgi:O-antigen/teichoic acid export membrane protein
MWLALPLIPLISLGALRAAMLRGLRMVVLGQFPERVLRPAGLVAAILLVLAVSPESLTPEVVVVGQIAATALAFAWGLRTFVRHRPSEVRHAVPTYQTRNWLQSSIPFGLSASLLLINGRTDLMALGMFRPDAEVGVYRVAVQCGLAIIFGMQAINAIQGPHIAHLYAKGQMKRLQTMVTRSSQAILAIALPAVIVIYVFGKPLIRLVFGAQYEAAYTPLLILSIGQIFNAGMGSVSSLLNMTGHERDTTRILLVAAVLNLSLTFTLTPLWGTVGAATATATTLTFWNVAMWYMVRRRIGIHASPFMRTNQ